MIEKEFFKRKPEEYTAIITSQDGIDIEYRTNESGMRPRVLEQLRQAKARYGAAERAHRVAETTYQLARQSYKEEINRAWKAGVITFHDFLKMMPRMEERK